MPRSQWSTSSQDPLLRVSAAAPAAAAPTVHQVLPHPGAPPVQSPPPAGLSDRLDPASCPMSRQERRKLTHRIYLISRSPHQTPLGWTLESLGVFDSRLHSGPAVLGGQGEAVGAGQGSVVQSGIVQGGAGPGLWPCSFLLGPQVASPPWQ